MDSHYRVPPLPGAPTNWRAPVDYASGTAFVRLEVLQKPSTQKTVYNVCFEGNQSACMGYPPAYTAPGTYDFSFAFSTFWQYTAVDWTKGVKNVALILKDENGNKVQGDAKFYPTTIHVVITLVPKGGTYVPPMSQTPKDAGPAMDSGMLDSGNPRDAGSPADADAGHADPSEPADARPAGSAGTGSGATVMDSGATLPATAGGSAAPVGGSESPRRDAGVIALHGADATPEPPVHEASDGCSVAQRRNGSLSAYCWLAVCVPVLRRLRRRLALR
jgi:hypothetical protein